MTHRRIWVRLGAAGGLCALALAGAGCGDRGQGKAARDAAAAGTHKGTPAEAALKKLLQTTTPGVRGDSGHAAIEMRFSVAPNPLPGEPFRVTVSVLAAESAPTLTISVPPSEGLSLGPVTTPLTYDKVERGAIYTIPLDYTAAEARVAIVTVTATEASPTGSDSATYSYPVVVGARSLAPPPSAAPPSVPAGAPVAPAAKKP